MAIPVDDIKRRSTHRLARGPEVLGESVVVAIDGVHESCERPSRLRAKMFFVFVYT